MQIQSWVRADPVVAPAGWQMREQESTTYIYIYIYTHTYILDLEDFVFEEDEATRVGRHQHSTEMLSRDSCSSRVLASERESKQGLSAPLTLSSGLLVHPPAFRG